MVDPKIKELQGTARRDFLRWGATVAACMGLERSRVLNVVNDIGGSALADTLQCATTRQLFSIVDGGGGLSNWTQVFPFKNQAMVNTATYSFYAPGSGTLAPNYDKDWIFHKNAPFQGASKWKMTGFLSGTNETHTQTPQTAANLGTNSMLASIAAIQSANPTLLPVLTVGTVQFGAAPGAPATAAVNASANLVDLFNSAASRALLQGATNGGLADQYYKAFLGLNAAAGRSTFAKQYGVGKVSMNLLSRNLKEQLTPSAADEAVFGITAATNGTIAGLARGMIIGVKAMALGLTSSVIQRGLSNDPHGLFAGGKTAADTVAASLKGLLDGLEKFSGTFSDPACTAKTLADRIVLTVHGDTYKQPFNEAGWGDGTPMNSNVLYVMGNGLLKTGWMGQALTNNTASGWDPATGLDTPTYTNGAMLGNQAAAAALYAMCGDARRVGDFFTGGAGAGVTRISLTGG